ncbi:malto-oligosyltrehalose trehalohydrolase [Corynebacterium epidermidicanis]|uniref:Malto-oligosyltrehalose trehalohydrolase n=1 Tax=Corynebacterium epidermidicanis TaxID=1050174 RepID=A0A0G3GSE2_9CORY|nr:malto-oligosyltrehalose trehalohydrolase [Corynebacterium epidermidicanis]
MTTYEVWAPKADAVRVTVDGTEHDLYAGDNGWWHSDLAATPGQRYGFSLRTGDTWSSLLPDPRSTSQPDGVHGLSEVTDHSFAWTDQDWTGRILPGQLIYELHVGTFSERGDFAGVVDKLGYLRELGVTSIELMPVQPFAGDRNWGYDGVFWHAVHAGYGGEVGLKELVDAAHRHRIAVILDVVYNHFGPEGNDTGMFGPYTAGGNTGWGEVINFSGPGSDEVRAYVLDAARRWFEEFHIDGLRLDAVHAMYDPGAIHVLEQLTYLTKEIEATTGIPRTLIAESDQNDPRIVSSQQAGGYGLDGQWIDDYHHALHTLVSGENHGYFADFGGVDTLAHVLKEVFFHAETFSTFRGRMHGRRLDTTLVPASSFVAYTTTHDQVGNRASGDRPSMNLSPEQQVLKAAMVLLAPFTPMLFMGEEFGAKTPFAFFVSHSDPELLRLTAEGRQREFARAGWNNAEITDPTSVEAFENSRLQWAFDDEQQRIFEAYQTLIRLRKQLQLARPYLEHLQVEYGENWLAFGYDDVTVVANFSDESIEVPFTGELRYCFDASKVSEHATQLAPWDFAVLV